MVRHEMVIRFRPDSPDRAIDRLIVLVTRICRQMPGVREVAFSRNHAEGYREAMMVVTLDDEEALERFTADPVYEALIRFVAPVIDDVAVDDVFADG